MDHDRIARIIPRLHWRLMPTLLMMYVLAFLDRANVGFAREGFAAHAGIGDAAFAFGASIFFIGYALLEVPSNLILYRVGARRWMCRIMVTWGLVSAATAFVSGPASYYAMRFLLGIAEAGFFPGVIFYLTCWYPRIARARSVGLFFYGAPIALSLGGPISGMLVAHDAFGLHGWQIMFIVEGLAASLGGIAVLFLLHDSPAAAPWLNAAEKTALLETLAQEERAHPRKHDVWQALRDPRLLFLALVYALIQMSFYGLTFYLPSQVAALFAGTGTATDSLLKVSAFSTTTQAGSYAINVTQLATQGSLKGSAAANTTIQSGVNDSLSVTLSGMNLTPWRVGAGNFCPLAQGQDYYFNVKFTNPEQGTTTCSSDSPTCAVSLVNNVNVP